MVTFLIKILSPIIFVWIELKETSMDCYHALISKTFCIDYQIETTA